MTQKVNRCINSQLNKIKWKVLTITIVDCGAGGQSWAGEVNRKVEKWRRGNILKNSFGTEDGISHKEKVDNDFFYSFFF